MVRWESGRFLDLKVSRVSLQESDIRYRMLYVNHLKRNVVKWLANQI